MEHRLQIRLQVASGDLLGDTVGDRWNAQRAPTTVCLRNLDPPHRRRKIAPRRQPVPELVEVVRRSTSNSAIDCASTPAAPWLAFTRLKASQTSLLGMSNGFALPTGAPVAGWPVAVAEQRSPFGPAPLQSLHPYYELLRPCAPLRYSGPGGVRRLDVSLGIGATGSHVPYKSLVDLRAAYMPDAARAGFRVLPS